MNEKKTMEAFCLEVPAVVWQMSLDYRSTDSPIPEWPVTYERSTLILPTVVDGRIESLLDQSVELHNRVSKKEGLHPFFYLDVVQLPLPDCEVGMPFRLDVEGWVHALTDEPLVIPARLRAA